MMNKLARDMKRNNMADELFTETLIALEKNDYEKAIRLADEVLEISISIEQKAGAMFLMSLAQTANLILTKVMLEEIYDVEGDR